MTKLIYYDRDVNLFMKNHDFIYLFILSRRIPVGREHKVDNIVEDRAPYMACVNDFIAIRFCNLNENLFLASTYFFLEIGDEKNYLFFTRNI